MEVESGVPREIVAAVPVSDLELAAPSKRVDAHDVPLRESFTRLLSLFSFKKAGLDKALAELDEKVFRTQKSYRPIWQPRTRDLIEKQTEFFLPFIKAYFSGQIDREPGEFDCEARELTKVALERFGRSLVFESRVAAFELRLCGIEVYFFSTEVGAAAIDVELVAVKRRERERRPGAAPRLALDDLIVLNYYLANMDSPRVDGSFKSDEAAKGTQPIANLALIGLRLEGGIGFQQLIRRLLGLSVERGLDFEPIDERAYKIQTFAKVDGQYRIEDLAEPFYRLRRAVKESYHPPAADTTVSDSGDVARTFDNVVHGVSLEGMATLVSDNGHEFFKKGQFSDRIRHAYFAHYLLALHQRTVLQLVGIEAVNLPYVRSQEAAVLEKTHQRAQDLRRYALDFNLHHRFPVVSIATPYVEIYERMMRALQIETLLVAMRDRVKEFEELLGQEQREKESKREREDKQRDLDHARSERHLNLLVAVFVGPSLLLALYGTNLPTYRSVMGYPLLAFWLPLALCGLWMAAVAVAYVVVRVRYRADARRKLDGQTGGTASQGRRGPDHGNPA